MTRVLLIGDGIALTTGFAQVLRQCAVAFNFRGFELAQLASLDAGPEHSTEPYTQRGVTPFFTNPYDVLGKMVLPVALKRFEPDVIFLNCDPGTAGIWHHELKKADSTIPLVLYAPIEGAPIAVPLANAFRNATLPYTYTRWSAEKLLTEHALEVPYVYHGVDTSTFHPFHREDKRREVRRQLGWEGKFVVMYVARNAGRKAQDRLIKAVAELVARGRRDVLLYLHCKSWDNNELQGWDLRFAAHWCGVTDYVQFADLKEAAHGEAQPGLAAKYAAADLYVHAAKVEGFGLPILEAMASGLPVITPADDGNMDEIAAPAALMRIEPPDWETWFNGAQLANVHPQQFAGAIEWAMNNPKARRSASETSVAWAHDPQFSWEPMTATLTAAVEHAAAREPVTA